MDDLKRWGIKYKRELVARGIKQEQLARDISVNRSIVCATLNGLVNRSDVRLKIENYFKKLNA